jgi:2-polyprenyl-3-methyl-5-hydroxy-6-metoxy-1,4-benzoquinol methylase
MKRACPACFKSDSKSIGTKNEFEILVCRNCQTLFTSRVPEFDEAENYDEYYTEKNLQVPEFTNQRLREILDNFEPYRQSNRLLDVGFGAGTILQVAAEKKWEAFGMEVSESAIKQARAQGFNVFHGELWEADYPEHYFDVVTASEIIEHLPDPQRFLKEVARILRPGGLLWATTPSSRGLSYRLIGLDWSIIFPPEHIQLFSKKAMARMLEEAGFSQYKIHTHGVNPMEIMHHFKSRNEGANSGFDRVETGYQLNENLNSSQTKKKIKLLMNNTLNFMQMGDSLKIFAQTDS